MEETGTDTTPAPASYHTHFLPSGWQLPVLSMAFFLSVSLFLVLPVWASHSCPCSALHTVEAVISRLLACLAPHPSVNDSLLWFVFLLPFHKVGMGRTMEGILKFIHGVKAGLIQGCTPLKLKGSEST